MKSFATAPLMSMPGKMGFKKAHTLKGGAPAWKKAGGQLVTPE